LLLIYLFKAINCQPDNLVQYG